MNEPIYESMNHEHTLYSIYLQLEHDYNITVGKLGECFFKRGTYIYIGSAKKYIMKRILRHKEIHKKLHWHFDYLRPYGMITKIITYDDRLDECALAENIRKKEDGMFPIKGFGSSDCRCPSHLVYVNEKQ
ncbi:GIY-YIG nuclease family protein [Niallia sp. Krafla_26]|uniref:GIY-YIG nuclease family protein n=1 Tax=Niallia sp. Krafla_26 TaxID=3064703 RepID=UPI003D17748F